MKLCVASELRKMYNFFYSGICRRGQQQYGRRAISTFSFHCDGHFVWR